MIPVVLLWVLLGFEWTQNYRMCTAVSWPSVVTGDETRSKCEVFRFRSVSNIVITPSRTGNNRVTTFLEFLETWKCPEIRLRSGKSLGKVGGLV